MKQVCSFSLAALMLCSGCAVKREALNPTGAAFSQAYSITHFKRLVFVSGQVPEDDSGQVPSDFRSQALLAWKNVKDQLRAADMKLTDIVKYTVFLSDRRYRRENYEVRHQVLGAYQPAMSIIITGIYDEKWLLEIEVIAAR